MSFVEQVYGRRNTTMAERAAARKLLEATLPRDEWKGTLVAAPEERVVEERGRVVGTEWYQTRYERGSARTVAYRTAWTLDELERAPWWRIDDNPSPPPAPVPVGFIRRKRAGAPPPPGSKPSWSMGEPIPWPPER